MITDTVAKTDELKETILRELKEHGFDPLEVFNLIPPAFGSYEIDRAKGYLESMTGLDCIKAMADATVWWKDYLTPQNEPEVEERSTKIHCPACSQAAHLAVFRSDTAIDGECTFCGKKEGIDGQYIAIVEARTEGKGFVCQSCAPKTAPTEYFKFVKAQRDRYTGIYKDLLAAIENEKIAKREMAF